MAITWNPKITPLNVSNYEATISATRTDSEDADNPKTYVVPKARIETTAEKSAVGNEIWAMHQADLTKATNLAAFIDGLEDALAANLEARE